MNTRIIDLTRTMHDGMEAYPGDVQGLAIEQLADFTRDGYALSRFSLLHAHCGTHFDSPRHFIERGADVSEVSPVAAPITLITIDKQEIGPDAFRAVGNLSGHAVLINTGWDAQIGTPRYYRDYPYITPSGARFLAEHKIAVVGLDTPSPDPPNSPDYPAHHILLGAGIPIVEGLVGLDHLIDVTALFLALPMKVKGMEASPIRAVALVTDAART